MLLTILCCYSVFVQHQYGDVPLIAADHFRIPTPGQGHHFCKTGSVTWSIFVIFNPRKIVLGHLRSANVIQIARMAVFPHISIDFLQISFSGHNFV